MHILHDSFTLRESSLVLISAQESNKLIVCLMIILKPHRPNYVLVNITQVKCFMKFIWNVTSKNAIQEASLRCSVKLSSTHKDTMRAQFRPTPWVPWAVGGAVGTPCPDEPLWCKPPTSCSRGTETGTEGHNSKLYNVMSFNMFSRHIGVKIRIFPAGWGKNSLGMLWKNH